MTQGLRIGEFAFFDRLTARLGLEPEALPGVPTLYRTIIPTVGLDEVMATTGSRSVW